MTSPRSRHDYELWQLLPSAGLTFQQCRNMQGVVMRRFMETEHEPAKAREILDALGLACHFTAGVEDLPLARTPVDLLWDHANGLTSQPKKKEGAG